MGVYQLLSKYSEYNDMNGYACTSGDEKAQKIIMLSGSISIMA